MYSLHDVYIGNLSQNAYHFQVLDGQSNYPSTVTVTAGHAHHVLAVATQTAAALYPGHLAHGTRAATAGTAPTPHEIERINGDALVGWDGRDNVVVHIAGLLVEVRVKATGVSAAGGDE